MPLITFNEHWKVCFRSSDFWGLLNSNLSDASTRSHYPLTSIFAFSLSAGLISDVRACECSAVCYAALQQCNTNNTNIQSTLYTFCLLFSTLTQAASMTTQTWLPDSELTPTWLGDYHAHCSICGRRHHCKLYFTLYRHAWLIKPKSVTLLSSA